MAPADDTAGATADAADAAADTAAARSTPTPAELPRVELDGVMHMLVGTIAVSDKVLGYGSHGTVVYGGRLDERPVAVKRVLREYCHVASREVSLLIKLDDHDNVVRYFAREVRAANLSRPYVARVYSCVATPTSSFPDARAHAPPTHSLLRTTTSHTSLPVASRHVVGARGFRVPGPREVLAVAGIRRGPRDEPS